jgi:hypothetical protein
MALIKLEAVTLGSVDVTEKMVQKQIEDDPSILGFGELELIDKERMPYFPHPLFRMVGCGVPARRAPQPLVLAG